MSKGLDNEKLITPSRYHRTLNGTVLAVMREKAGLTQAEFAEMCGWSQQYQQRLERPGLHEIHIDKASEIIATIESVKTHRI